MTPAFAHTYEHPKILRLGIQANRVLLAVTYDVNPGQDALRTRGLFDRDSDGALSAPEQARLLDALEKTCWLWLQVRVGEKKLTWTRRERVGHRLDRAATDDSGLGLALLYEAALPPRGAMILTVEDRDRDRAKHVPLQMDLDPAWRLTQAEQGEWFAQARQLSRVTLSADRPLTLHLEPALAP